MAKTLEIPQDIIDSVITEVGDDTHLLKQCVLVSSSFLLPSRRQLFSRITLRSEQTCQGIYQLLVQNPVMQSYVRSIILTEDIDSSGSENHESLEWMNGTSLLAILRLPFYFLVCFSIDLGLKFRNGSDPNPWNWNSFCSELKDALLNIIHSSDLKTLSLKGINNLPITFFLHTHLTTLELYSISPRDFGVSSGRSENSNSMIWAALKGDVPTDSHVMIDRCVWYLKDSWKGFVPILHGTRFPSSAFSH